MIDYRQLRRGARLMGRTLAGSFGLGFMVAGVGLVGLSVAVFSEVLGVAGFGLVPSTEAGLGSGLVLLAVGWFLVGAAWEELLGRVPRKSVWASDELALVWGASLVTVGAVLTVAGRMVDELARDLWPGLSTGGEMLLAAGLTGLVVAPVIMAGLWAWERLWPRRLLTDRTFSPVVLAGWGLSALVVFMTRGF